MTSFKTSWLAGMIAAFACTACLQQQPQGPGANSPAAPTDKSPVPTNTQGPGTGQMGTVTGGGGNGIDNKALETYAVHIDTLPEYRKYIAPIFQRMSRGKPDILLGYFNWAISHKAWLFLPTDFDSLAKEQVGVNFSSDQLARNYPKEVHISATRYNSKSPRDKAYLLMHEIVMSARFLMKQPPEVQCAALNQGNEKQCTSPEMLKLARMKTYDEKARESLDNVDHDSVRVLTVYLMTKDQDLTGETISRVRRNLGFEFPWDQLESSLGLGDLIDAINRANLAGDILASPDVPNGNSENPVQCYPQVSFHSGYANLNMLFLDPRVIEPGGFQNPYGSNETITRNGRSETHPVIQRAFVWTSEDGIEAKGALDPRDGEHLIDVVRVLPNLSYYWSYGTAGEVLSVLEFYLSRETTPRLIEIRSIPVRLLKKTTSTSDDAASMEIVLTRDRPIVCKIAN